MNKTNLTTMVEYGMIQHLTKKNNIYGALEVNLEINKIADFVGIKNNNIYVVEFKTSLSDFKSKNGHNFLGNINYYAMTEDLYYLVNDMIPNHIGIYIVSEIYNSGKWHTIVEMNKQAKKIKSDLDIELITERIKNCQMTNIVRYMGYHYQRKKENDND